MLIGVAIHPFFSLLDPSGLVVCLGYDMDAAEQVMKIKEPFISLFLYYLEVLLYAFQ